MTKEQAQTLILEAEKRFFAQHPERSSYKYGEFLDVLSSYVETTAACCLRCLCDVLEVSDCSCVPDRHNTCSGRVYRAMDLVFYGTENSPDTPEEDTAERAGIPIR